MEGRKITKIYSEYPCFNVETIGCWLSEPTFFFKAPNQYLYRNLLKHFDRTLKN